MTERDRELAREFPCVRCAASGRIAEGQHSSRPCGNCNGLGHDLEAYPDQIHALLSRVRGEGCPLSIEVYQQDWIPGFAAFHDDGSATEWGKNPDAKPHVVLNLAANLQAVEAGDIPKAELPYIIAENIMHEVIHVLEAWAGNEFSEERVEKLLSAYRAKYAPDAPEYTQTIGDGWIAVETKMPPDGKRVVVSELAKSYKRITVGMWDGTQWRHGDKETGYTALGRVTAWQPLPPPPDGEKE